MEQKVKIRYEEMEEREDVRYEGTYIGLIGALTKLIFHLGKDAGKESGEVLKDIGNVFRCAETTGMEVVDDVSPATLGKTFILGELIDSVDGFGEQLKQDMEKGLSEAANEKAKV